MRVWNDYYLNRAKVILGSQPCTNHGYQTALDHMNREFPFQVTKSSLHHALQRGGFGTPSDHLGKPYDAPSQQYQEASSLHQEDTAAADIQAIRSTPTKRGTAPQIEYTSEPPQELSDQPTPSRTSRRAAALDALEKFAPLNELMRKGPVSFRELCNKLNMSPANTEQYIADAQKAGIEVSVAHDHVGIDTEAPKDVQDTYIPAVVGERQTIAVISDTHLGSKYCMRAQLKDFVNYAYHERGVRTILHVGDVLDGNYHHSVFELTHSGLEDQAFDLIETLPQLPGLTYHGITGNHDETFWKKSGVNVGRVIEAHFQDAGRSDMFFYGDRDAFLKVHGIVVHLWHPTGSASYAKSYHPQKKVEAYMHIKPQILLCGHWHQYVHLYERGVHAIACPTFQGSMSRFSRSLKGNQAQGGLILSWDLTEYGMIRNFILEPRFYYEIERPVEIHNHVDAQGVAPAVSRPTAQVAGPEVAAWNYKQR